MNRRPELDPLLFERPPLQPHLNSLPEGEEREAIDLETGGRYFAPQKENGEATFLWRSGLLYPFPSGRGEGPETNRDAF